MGCYIHGGRYITLQGLSQASRSLGYGHIHGCCDLFPESLCYLAAGLTLAPPFVCPREKLEQMESRASLASQEERVQLDPR